MTSIMMFRSVSVGVDTSSYSRIYKHIIAYESLLGSFKYTQLTAPVYVAFCRFLGLISKNPQILTIASSLFINIGLFIFIKRVSANFTSAILTWIGLTLFYCSMNGARQCMALVLVLNAICYLLDNKKNIKGWLLLVLAIGIHATTICILPIFLGIYFAEKNENEKTILAGSIIAGLVSGIFFKKTIFLIIRFIPQYAIYTNNKASYNIFKGTGGGRIALLYIFLLFAVILWMYILDKEEKSKFNRLLFPAIIFGLVFGIVNCKNELINRMLWFYLALMIPLIAELIEKNKTNLIIKYGIITMLLLYSLVSIKENQNGVVPYEFFWNHI